MNDVKERTVSASYMATLLEAFAEAGCARADLLAHTGLSEAEFSNPDARLPVETVTKAWKTAKTKSKDGLIGLRVG